MVKKTGYPIFSTMDQSYKGDWFIRLDGNLITPRINPFTPLIRCTKYRAESLRILFESEFENLRIFRREN